MTVSFSKRCVANRWRT